MMRRVRFLVTTVAIALIFTASQCWKGQPQNPPPQNAAGGMPG
jgi:hypothetical protein